MNRSGKLHALLSTARVANIPSVVSNVWLGVVIGLFFGDFVVLEIPWNIASRLALAGVTLYVAGNFFNDWMDRGWDASHRPERALPRGLFRAGLYVSLASALGVLGIGLAASVNPRCALVAGIIAASICIYTLWHKRSAWAVIPMGLCRALLPVMGYMAFQPYLDGIWPAAGGLFCYIIGLSLSARHESMAEPPRRVVVMARGLLLATAILMAGQHKGFQPGLLMSLAGVLPYLAWTSFCLRFRKKPVSALVSGLLAGIPWVDWIVLLPIFLSLASDGAGWIGFAVACFAIPPLAFVSALLLQRLAPAT
jgi:4-hydroxybenzoate polyprenyltransferase